MFDYEPGSGAQQTYGDLLAEIAEATGLEPVWRNPAVLAAGLPRQAGNGRAYRGINVLLLWHAAPSPDVRTWTPTEDTSDVVVVVGRPPGPGRPSARVARYVAPRASPLPAQVPTSPDWLASRLAEVVDGWRPRGAAQERCASGTLSLAKKGLLESEASKDPRLPALRDALGANAGALIAEMAAAFVLAHFGIGARVQAVRGSLPRLRASGPPPGHRLLPVAASIAQRLADWMVPVLEETQTPETAEGGSEDAAPNGLHQLQLFSAPPTQERTFLPATTRKLIEACAALSAQPDAESVAVLAWIEANPEAAERALTERDGDTVELLWAASCVPRTRHAERAPSEAQQKANAAWEELGTMVRARIEKQRELPFVPPHVATQWARLRTRHLSSTWFHHRKKLSFRDIEWKTGSLTRWSNHRLQRLTAPMGEDDWSLAAMPTAVLGGCIGVQRTADEIETEALDSLLPGGARSGGLWPWESLLRGVMANEPYREETRRKKDGSTRTLHVPNEGLARVQRWIADRLIAHWPVPGTCAGLARNRSAAYHARIHAGARQAVVVDVRDFFGSVRPEQVEEWLKPDKPRPVHSSHRGPFRSWSVQGRAALLRLLFRWPSDGPPHLPQGAPSSPVAANLAACRMDARIERVAEKVFPPGTWHYSRYADDLVISTTGLDKDFPKRALQILRWGVRSMGWRLHPRKTRWWRVNQGVPLVVCGLRVPEDEFGALQLSREHRRRLRNIVHRWRHGERHLPSADRGLVAYAYQVTGDASLLALVSGRLSAFASAIAGEHAADFLRGWAPGD